jgi:hypothetical protein
MVYTQDKLGMGICAATDERNLPQISYVPDGVTRPQTRDYLEAVNARISCIGRVVWGRGNRSLPDFFLLA